MTSLGVHILLFMVAGAVFLLLPLLIGLLVRPKKPTAEKSMIYECGEPTIGSSRIQFDLRFYTVALLFIIFDVEVAFFFPWAMVYGGATQLADPNLQPSAAVVESAGGAAVESAGGAARLAVSEKLLNQEPGTMNPADAVTPQTARVLAWTGFFDILVFFGVLLVGFAYVWKRGDLDWVRSVVGQEQRPRMRSESPPVATGRPEPETVA